MASLHGSIVEMRESYIFAREFIRDWAVATFIVTVMMVGSASFYPIIKDTIIGSYIREQIEQLREVIERGSTSPLALLIIANNLRVLLIMAVTVPTIIIPVGILAFQGVLVGYLSSMLLENPIIEAQGVSITITPMYVYLALVVHGVIEIPAFSLIVAPVMSLRKRGFWNTFKLSLSLLPASIIILSIAAIVESIVTPSITTLYLMFSIARG